jgi:hypothetical protein
MGSGSSPSPVEFSSHHRFYKLSGFWLLGMCCCSCRLACLFTAHMGDGSSPLFCGVFLPLPLSQAFPFLVAGHSCPLRPGPACLFTVLGGIPFPPLWCSGHPTLFATCLYCSWSVQEAMPVWPRDVCGSTASHLAHLVRVFPSHLGMGDWQWPRSPPGFSVQHEVRCSVQAGGVEGSKFCLFSVALAASCVSSVSPRFHYRRHAFCFLPLAAILERSWRLLKNLNIDLPSDTAIPLLGIYPKECNTGYSKGTWTPMFIAVLFTIAKLWKQPRCPTID